ncbi:MAG: hypothetical protein LBK55_08640, partial [Azoarcus sp.]|nr:hypothetical protein [Azoarcus sp.]
MVPNQVVATVNSVKGHAFARGPDGLRPLKPGDSIYDGETLITEEGPVVVTPDIGPPYRVDPHTEIAMATDSEPEDAEITPEQIERLIAQLQPNNLEDFPPTDAGPPNNDGPSDPPLIIARVSESIDPLSSSDPGPGSDTLLPSRPRGSGDDDNSDGGSGGGDPSSWHGVDDVFSVVEGSTTSFGSNAILGNDGSAGISVGKIIIGGGNVDVNVDASGTTFTTALGGTVTIYPDGHFDYTAPVRDHSDTELDQDSFQYRAVNSNDVASDPITVKINITDTVPVAHDDVSGDTSYISRNLGNVITGVGPNSADEQSADGGARV